MRKNTKTYKEVVRILDQNAQSVVSRTTPRDSDSELIVQMMQIIHGADLNSNQVAIIRGMNFESITRCRRKLQEKGEYLPSPEVAKKRRLKSYEIQQVAPKETAPGIQRRIEQNA